MKFSGNLALLALAAVTSATESPTLVKDSPPSLVGRDLATVTSVVAAVDTNIKALNTAVTGFSAANLAALATASGNLLTSLKDGASAIQASAELSLTDAVALQGTVTSLQTDGQALVSSLGAKKTAFEQAGLCSTLLQQTTDINTASKTLIDTIVGKVPQAAQGVAQQLAGGVTAALTQAQGLFAAGNCTNAAGAGGGASASASATGGGAVNTQTNRATSTGALASTSLLGGGQGQCMCPCACTTSRAPVQTTRATVSAPVTTRPAANTTRPAVVTAGGATAGYGAAGVVAAGMAVLLL